EVAGISVCGISKNRARSALHVRLAGKAQNTDDVVVREHLHHFLALCEVRNIIISWRFVCASLLSSGRRLSKAGCRV
ncbi:hypothetical protein PENTCL1PPCAC_8949, partial [Pristionchus entomophagus]